MDADTFKNMYMSKMMNNGPDMAADVGVPTSAGRKKFKWMCQEWRMMNTSVQLVCLGTK